MTQIMSVASFCILSNGFQLALSEIRTPHHSLSPCPSTSLLPCSLFPATNFPVMFRWDRFPCSRVSHPCCPSVQYAQPFLLLHSLLLLWAYKGFSPATLFLSHLLSFLHSHYGKLTYSVIGLFCHFLPPILAHY